MEQFSKAIKDRRPVFGLCADHFCRPLLAKLYKASDADFVYLEYEHSFYSANDLHDFLLMCKTVDLPLVVKTPYLDRGAITKLLDAGATGIQLPMTETEEQIRTLHDYVKFPPEGKRAAGHDFTNTGYGDVEDYSEALKGSNRNTLVIAHVETAKSVENIDSILGSGCADIMFIGAFDLSVSLGHPAKMDHPEVQKAIRILRDSALRHNVAAGLYVPTAEKAEYWLHEGFTFFEIASEVEFILNGAESLIKSLKGISGQERVQI